jgi:TPR repeat protein
MRQVAAAVFVVAGVFSASLSLAGVEEDYEKANEAQGRGDFMVAMPLLKKTADAGYGPAQSLFADMLDASESQEEAVGYYIKAAEQGDAHGQSGLARMLSAGRGVARDNAKALEWLRKAAAQDYLDAVKVLMGAYQTGAYGVTPDPGQAKELEARFKILNDKFVKEQQEKEKAKAAKNGEQAK